MGKLFTADFETSTPSWLDKDEETRVWAYALCEIGDPENFIYGNSIDDFIKWCSNKKCNFKLWFHNLKFDGEYIFYYLLNNGYTFVPDKKFAKDKTFTCLISSLGQFYSIEIFFEVKKKKINKVTIYDSLKILNFSVDKIAKDFNLPIRKLNLDYDKYREVGHELTPEEIDYIRNDVEIMARALKILFDQGHTKMTIGSDALADFKDGLKYFNKYFPVLDYEIDTEIRKSYKGGWTYLNPIYAEKRIKEGIVIDKNSMHPSHMYYDYLPFGQPMYFEGEYVKDVCYPLYVQKLSCSFKIKKGKLPSIQLKNTFGFKANEYVETTNGEIVTMTLTNIDVELLFSQYDVDDLVYHYGYKFKRICGLFNSYIDKWTERKTTAKKEGNGANYLISKLFLNSLYGKFGLNPCVRGKYPVLTDEGTISYELSEAEIRNSIYVPVASFITAYSRYDIITTSQKIRDYSLEKYGEDYYIYSDTDSCHCKKMTREELATFLDIDTYRLGAWDLESEFKQAIFIRQKCYIEEGYDGKLNTTIAGLPKKLGKYLTLENFKKGFSVLATDDEKDHKLMFKHTKGGVLLVDTDFTIK